MSRAQQVIWAIIIVVILGGGYWWWASSQPSSPSEAGESSEYGTTTETGAPMIPATSTSDQSSGGSTSAGLPTSVTVTFNGSSFSPANVTIAQGGTVTFTSTAGPMWVASDPHPIHNGYDGTTEQQHCAPGYTGAAPFDQCQGSTSFSFTFNKVGTWGYHDHLDESVGGSVTVVAQ